MSRVVRNAVALVLFTLVAAFPGVIAPAMALAAPTTGRLEIVAMNNNQDVTGQCQVGVVSEDGSVFRMLTPIGGVISADLPPGPYQCTVMYVSKSGAVSIAQVAADIRAGAVTRRTAIIGGTSMPGFSQPAYKSGEGINKPAGRGSVNLDDVMAHDELVAMAEALKEEYYSGLSLKEKHAIDSELRKLDREEPFLSRAVTEMTSMAATMAGMSASEAMSSILAAAAVEAKPDHALAVCNLGGVLHLLERLEDSVEVLKYARSLESKSPVILTNLANSAYDLGDEKTAEKLYNSALRCDSEYAPAHRGLGDLYFARGKWKEALEHYLKTAEYGYSARAGRAISDVQTESGDDDLPPPPWSSAGGQGGSGSSGSSGSSGLSVFSAGGQSLSLSQIRIPPGPFWPDYVTLAKSFDGLFRSASKHLEMMGGAGSNGRPGGASSGGPGVISYSKQLDQLTYLASYYGSKIKKASECANGSDFSGFTMGEMMRLDDEVREIQARWEKALINATTEEQIKKILEAWCRELDALHQAYFARWMGEAKRYYSELSLLLEEFQQDAAPIVTSIYDPNVFREADDLRRGFILVNVGSVIQDWSGAAIGFATPLGPPCNRAGVAGNVEEADVPQGEAEPCPFKNGKKLKISIGPLSLSLDCTTLGVDFGEGLVVGGDWNFKEKRVTSLRVGVGAKAEVGVGISGGDGSYALGLTAGGSTSMKAEFTFDEGGGVSDIRGSYESGAGVSGSVLGVGSDASVSTSLVVGTGGYGDVALGR